MGGSWIPGFVALQTVSCDFRFVEFRFCFMKSVGKVGQESQGVRVKRRMSQRGAGVLRIRRKVVLPLRGIFPGCQAHERADAQTDQQACERLVDGGDSDGEAEGRAEAFRSTGIRTSQPQASKHRPARKGFRLGNLIWCGGAHGPGATKESGTTKESAPPGGADSTG